MTVTAALAIFATAYALAFTLADGAARRAEGRDLVRARLAHIAKQRAHEDMFRL